MTPTQEQIKQAWVKWNEESDSTIHNANAEQILEWLEGMRAFQWELWQSNPDYQKTFEAERFAYLKAWEHG